MNNKTENAKTQTRTFWDANPCGLSDTWERARELRYSITDPYLLHYLTRDRFTGQTVLEVGCGQGADADALSKYCDSYIGIDLSEESVRIAKREVEKRASGSARLGFLAADAEALPFRDRQFSLLYSIGVLHHTPRFQVAISEAHRVLDDNGTLMLMLYRSYTPLWILVRILRGLLKVPMIGPWVKKKVINRLRTSKTRHDGSLTGTALLELVGCPIIDTFTLGGLRRQLEGRFVIGESECYRVGFDQLVRCTPAVMRRLLPSQAINWGEKRLCRKFGFYLFVTARKVN